MDAFGPEALVQRFQHARSDAFALSLVRDAEFQQIKVALVLIALPVADRQRRDAVFIFRHEAEEVRRGGTGAEPFERTFMAPVLVPRRGVEDRGEEAGAVGKIGGGEVAEDHGSEGTRDFERITLR